MSMIVGFKMVFLKESLVAILKTKFFQFALIFFYKHTSETTLQ